MKNDTEKYLSAMPTHIIAKQPKLTAEHVLNNYTAYCFNFENEGCTVQSDFKPNLTAYELQLIRGVFCSTNGAECDSEALMQTLKDLGLERHFKVVQK